MNAIQIVGAVLGIAGICVLGYHFYLLLKNQKQFLDRIRYLDTTLYGRAQSVVLYLSWLVFTAGGIRMLLFGIPSDFGGYDEDGGFLAHKDYLSCLLALFTLPILTRLKSFAQNKLWSEALVRRTEELENILHNVTLLKFRAAEYQKKVVDPAFASDHAFLVEMRDLCDAADDKIGLLLTDRLKMWNKEQAEQVALAEVQECQQKRNESARRLVDEIQAELRPWTDSWSERHVTSIDQLVDKQRPAYLIAPNLVAERWRELEEVAEELIVFRGSLKPYCVDRILDAFEEVTLMEGCRLMAQSSRSGSSGRTEVFANRGVETIPLFEAVTFWPSVEGLLEGMFMAHQFPKYGNYDHGYYDRDYQFIFHIEDYARLLLNNTQIAPKMVSAWGRIPGVRIAYCEDSLVAMCPVFFPDGTVIDKGVYIGNGKLTVYPGDVVYEPPTRVFY